MLHAALLDLLTQGLACSSVGAMPRCGARDRYKIRPRFAPRGLHMTGGNHGSRATLRILQKKSAGQGRRRDLARTARKRAAYLPWAQPRLSRSPDLERKMAKQGQARPVTRVTGQIVVIPRGQHAQVRDHASVAAWKSTSELGYSIAARPA